MFELGVVCRNVVRADRAPAASTFQDFQQSRQASLRDGNTVCVVTCGSFALPWAGRLDSCIGMGNRPTLGDFVASAHQAAAEVRTIGDYDRAQMVVALRAALVTQRFGDGNFVGRMLRDYFCAEAWRLARH